MIYFVLYCLVSFIIAFCVGKFTKRYYEKQGWSKHRIDSIILENFTGTFLFWPLILILGPIMFISGIIIDILIKVILKII